MLFVCIKSSHVKDPFLVSRSESDLKSWKLSTMEITDGQDWLVKGDDYVQSNMIHFDLQRRIDESLESLTEDPSIIKYLYNNEAVIRHIHNPRRQMSDMFRFEMTAEMKELFKFVYVSDKETVSIVNTATNQEKIVRVEDFDFKKKYVFTAPKLPANVLFSTYKTNFWDISLEKFLDYFPKCGEQKFVRRDIFIHNLNALSNLLSVMYRCGTPVHVYDRTNNFKFREPDSVDSQFANISQQIYSVKLVPKGRCPPLTLFYCLYNCEFYTEYFFDPRDFVKNGVIPLCLTDENQSISDFGTFDKYLTFGNYVCKAFDYQKQLHKTIKECDDCGLNMYSFIGPYYSEIWPFHLPPPPVDDVMESKYKSKKSKTKTKTKTKTKSKTKSKTKPKI